MIYLVVGEWNDYDAHDWWIVGCYSSSERANEVMYEYKERNARLYDEYRGELSAIPSGFSQDAKEAATKFWNKWRDIKFDPNTYLQDEFEYQIIELEVET